MDERGKKVIPEKAFKEKIKKPRVFIPQEPQKKDPEGNWISIMDFTMASEYGQPIVCLPPGPVALSPYPTKERLREVLKDFSDDDYIISAGDPTVIFLVAMIVCDINRGKCKMLKRNRATGRYIEVQIDIHKKLGGI